MTEQAPPTQVPFDVDRLARALHDTQCVWLCSPTRTGVQHMNQGFWHDEAERITLAYRMDTPKFGLNYIRVSSWSEGEKQEAWGK